MAAADGSVLWTRPTPVVQPVVLGYLTVTVHRCVGLGDASEDLTPHVQVRSRIASALHTQLPILWLTCATGIGWRLGQLALQPSAKKKGSQHAGAHHSAVRVLAALVLPCVKA
jgi:hypothetical protein